MVYAGSGIIGYGKLIIIKNSENFLSAYADNDEILVKEGEAVQHGDRIATMGLGREAGRCCISRYATTANPWIP